MSKLLSKLQVTDPKSWTGMTRESHFGYIGANEPQWLSQKVRRLYELNYGDDTLSSIIDKLPSIELDHDGEYQWHLQGSDERRVAIVGAAASRASAISGSYVTDGSVKLGIGKSQFYMVFPERYFAATSVIAGPRPESYQIRVVTDPESLGDNYLYTVEFITGDMSLFVPFTDVTFGTTFAEMYGQTEQELSLRGNNGHHSSSFLMRNTTSMIRKNYEVSGNMISKGAPAMAIAYEGAGGKPMTKWIDKLGFDMATQFRRDKTRLLLYGKSNKMDDGTYGNRGESGNVIKSGFGLFEQMEGGNITFYNKFSIDLLTQFALGMTVGKVREDNRKFTLVTGEYGAIQFFEALSAKANTYSYLTSEKHFKDGGRTFDVGQTDRVILVNGIEFTLVIDPMQDDTITNGGLLHPNGGLMSSYVYNIFDFGSTNGEANIKKVTIKGQDEIMYYVPGMRDPFSPGAPIKNTANHKDGYDVGFAWWGGVAIVNPLATGRLLPQGW